MVLGRKETISGENRHNLQKAPSLSLKVFMEKNHPKSNAVIALCKCSSDELTKHISETTRNAACRNVLLTMSKCSLCMKR
jgi:hypothetical protein